MTRFGVKFDPMRHQRRSVRMPGYDYSSPGAYFVTICTRRRMLYFDLPALRAHAENCWRAIAVHAPRVTLDEWVVMPNHVHGIIVINEAGDDEPSATVTPMTGVEDPGRGVQLNAPYASSLEMTKGSSWGIITVAKPRMINQRASHDYDNAS
jgi:hypothetical protein